MTALRFLMMLHMPWERIYGGARVQIEVAEELTRRGHHVEVFDWRAAFPREARSRIGQYLRPSFSVKARAFVRANAARFDVIDAHQGNLPFTKRDLGFRGLLVARSVGLYSFYDDFAREAATRWPARKTWRARVGRWLEASRERRETALMAPSFAAADLINVPNQDESSFIQNELGLGAKCEVLPFGLSDARLAAFMRDKPPDSARVAAQKVAFIGAWGARKGAHDWGAIVRRIRSAVPLARFAFLGTGCSAAVVHRDLGTGPCEWIDVVPRFGPDELPELLRAATVGAFPSYIEGQPFAVLEKLAAGLPTVAYDVPGPRALLRDPAVGSLTSRGDVAAFSRAVSSLLQTSPSAYGVRAARCRETAAQFRWPPIVDRMLDLYRQRLERAVNLSAGRGAS